MFLYCMFIMHSRALMYCDAINLGCLPRTEPSRRLEMLENAKNLSPSGTTRETAQPGCLFLLSQYLLSTLFKSTHHLSPPMLFLPGSTVPGVGIFVVKPPTGLAGYLTSQYHQVHFVQSRTELQSQNSCSQAKKLQRVVIRTSSQAYPAAALHRVDAHAAPSRPSAPRRPGWFPRGISRAVCPGTRSVSIRVSQGVG